jgi:MFS family permease
VLFLTEMWERFSYYGMRALLVYYMVKQLAFAQGCASHIYGFYTGFVYLTPLFGGILADRVLGQRKTVILGAVLMAIGHFMMAFESLFFPALLFLILGNGAFKPNISTQVGNLYAPGDSRRDRAFSIFYVGINLGAFFSPLVWGRLVTRLASGAMKNGDIDCAYHAALVPFTGLDLRQLVASTYFLEHSSCDFRVLGVYRMLQFPKGIGRGLQNQSVQAVLSERVFHNDLCNSIWCNRSYPLQTRSPGTSPSV